MKKNGIIALAIAGLISATSAIAGPFGLDMGMALKNIPGKREDLGNGMYKFTSVPKPHSAFEAYVVQVSPKHGLCWIKAVGKDIPTNVYGIELKSAFNDMKGRLEKTYGQHDTTDFLMPDSIWNESNEFMMGMHLKQRYLMALWDAENNSDLTDNLRAIGLVASANGRDQGYISIEYSFQNEEACEAELTSQEDSVL